MVTYSTVLRDVWGLTGPFPSWPLAPRAEMFCHFHPWGLALQKPRKNHFIPRADAVRNRDGKSCALTHGHSSPGRGEGCIFAVKWFCSLLFPLGWRSRVLVGILWVLLASPQMKPPVGARADDSHLLWDGCLG